LPIPYPISNMQNYKYNFYLLKNVKLINILYYHIKWMVKNIINQCSNTMLKNSSCIQYRAQNVCDGNMKLF